MWMLLVSTWAWIGIVCGCKLHDLWVPVIVPVPYWRGYPIVGGHTFPSEFHIIHIFCVLGSWGYIIGWSPLVWYQLEFWCICIKSVVLPSRFFKCHSTFTLPLELEWYCWLWDCRGYFWRRCADIFWVTNNIPPHCESCSMWHLFFWLILLYNVAICHILDSIPRHLVFHYE